jgi:hypothetical protein
VLTISYFGEKPTVTTVSIDGLEETKRNPNVDRKNVQVTRVPAVQYRSSNGTSAKDENFSRVGIFGGEPKRCRILVVELVNVFIKYASMKRLVSYDNV